MTETKSPLTSKTINFNALVLALVPIFDALGWHINTELLLSLSALANIILRMVTNKAINGVGASED